MLVELAVRNLGVIADVRLPLRSGMTALTGETGAGKTMIVEALELLRGGRADPGRVRPGADEAVVEALFVDADDRELVLRRVVPASGRSRSYADGELVTSARLEELTGALLEIHGQHSQQGLLRPGAQRDALDRFAEVDRAPLREARDRVQALRRRLDSLGGDDREREREADLLRYQIDEITAIDPTVGEDDRLSAEEDLLAGAVEHRTAGDAAVEALTADDGVNDQLSRAAARLDGREPFRAVRERLEAVALELADVSSELRDLTVTIEPDEERLGAIRGRRHALAELRRKYGERVEDILEFAASTKARLDELEGRAVDAAAVTAELAEAQRELDAVARVVGAARRAAAPELADAVAATLRTLALPECRVAVAVEDTDELPGAGELVTVLLAANPGADPAPLQRVASGGELSRVMLALRLVSSGGPPTMVFDEVDAGIGGTAANAVSAALADVGSRHQVLVVTHLPQIAAAAQHQLAATKETDGVETATSIVALADDERVVEVSRMLSGSPDSATARQHARELLGAAGGGS